MINRKWRLFDELIDRCAVADPEGTIIEFGTGAGGTAIGLHDNFPGQVVTIDWFAGLPQTEKEAPPIWRKGAFKADARTTIKRLDVYPRMTLIQSDIRELEPPEVYGLKRIVGVHIDVDIYESTVAALRYVNLLEWDRITIRFDDWGDGVYLKHEPAALEEWLEASGHKETERIVVNVGDNPGYGMRQSALVEVQRGVAEKKRRKKARRKAVDKVPTEETAEDPATDVDPPADETKAEEVATAPAAGSFEALWARVDTVGNPIMMSEATARTLADVLIEHQPKDVVEIGTHLGRSGALIASVIKEWGGKLTSYDPYNPRFLSTRQRQVLMGKSSFL